MINFDNLEDVETVNSRINYDLRFSQATGKFTLSADAYRKYDINNNGFLLKKEGNTPVLKVTENALANVHRGRSDADQKGKTFTADSLADMLGLEKGEEDAKFTFDEHENDGDTYLTLSRMGEESEDTSITDSEETEETDTEEGVNAGSGAVDADTEEENPMSSW